MTLFCTFHKTNETSSTPSLLLTILPLASRTQMNWHNSMEFHWVAKAPTYFHWGDDITLDGFRKGNLLNTQYIKWIQCYRWKNTLLWSLNKSPMNSLTVAPFTASMCVEFLLLTESSWPPYGMSYCWGPHTKSIDNALVKNYVWSCENEV